MYRVGQNGALRDSACWRSGEITQPWTNFFVQLCTSNLFSALRLRSFLAPIPPSPNEKEREPATTFWLAMKGNLIWQHKAGFCSLTAVKELVLEHCFDCLFNFLEPLALVPTRRTD